jgi:hypothetical protein
MPRLPLDPSDYYRNPYVGATALPAAFMPGDDDDPDEPETDWMGSYPASLPVGSPAAAPPSATEAAPVSRQKSPAELRSQEDYDKLRTELSAPPTMTQPKWWQGAAAGLAGFGAGWSNAAGRTRHPIDIGAMQDSIMHPGYKQRLQEWQSRVGPLQQIATLDRSQADQERRSRGLDIQEDWNKARANKDNALAKWWQNRPYPTPKVAETQADRIQRVEAAKKAGYKIDDNMANYFIVNGNLTGFAGTLANPDKPDAPFTLAPGAQRRDPSGKLIAENPRPPKEENPLAEILRQQHIEENERKTSAAINKTKADTEDRVRVERERLLKPLLTQYAASSEADLYTIKNPERKAKAIAALHGINQGLAAALQRAQNEYADAIRAHGGQAVNYTVDPLTLASTPRK